MNKILTSSMLVLLFGVATASAQVPGMPERTSANEGNSLSMDASNAQPFQPGHRGVEPQALTATPAEAAIPQSRPAATVQVPPAHATPQPPSVQGPSLPAPAPSVPISETITNIDAQLLELARLQQDTERTRAQLELLNAQEQIQEISRRTSGTQMGLTEVPLLVGIMTDRGRLVAEFLANGAVLQVSEGEMVSPEWQLQKIRQTSVEIKRRGRSERHILMFGGSAKAP